MAYKKMLSLWRMKQAGLILVLDDDKNFITSLEFSLGNEFRILSATTINEAEEILNSQNVDVILLDYHLGQETGHDFLDRIGQRPNLPPVIATSGHLNMQMALGFLKRKIAGFVEKPVSLVDLRAALAKALPKTEERDSVAGFEIAHATRSVQLDGKNITLTPTEYEILTYFVGKPREQVTRQVLVQHLWGESNISRNALDTHLLNLKKKVPPFADKLVSVYGAGYCYEP